jgi:predicted RNA-binding Zn-ribbon protein involved in translation (DUF1610 family)
MDTIRKDINKISSLNKRESKEDKITDSTEKKVTTTRSYTLRHLKCGNTWIYRGKSSFHATCTRCGIKISIEKHRLDKLDWLWS